MSILGTDTYTLRRYTAPGVWGPDGEYTPGPFVDSSIEGSLQPANDRVLQSLPEGDRNSDPMVLLSYTEMRTASQYTGVRADEILVGGIRYEVRLASQETAVLPHWRGTLLRIQETTP